MGVVGGWCASNRFAWSDPVLHLGLRTCLRDGRFLDCTLSFLHVSWAVICGREFPMSRFTSPNAHKCSLAAHWLIHYLRGKPDHLAAFRVSLGSKSPLSHNPLGKTQLQLTHRNNSTAGDMQRMACEDIANFKLVIVHLSVISQGVEVEYPTLTMT